MNRTIRRQQERDKDKKTATYNYNPQQLHGMIDERLVYNITNARREVANAMTAVICMIMHDKYGWRKKRLNRLMDDIVTHFDCVADKYVSLEDISNFVESLGVRKFHGGTYDQR